MIQRLPFVPSVANYRIGTTIAGVEYLLDVRWNGRDAAWYFDILEVDETVIRAGMKITLGALPGVRSASAQFPDGLFLVYDSSGAGLEATYNDMGTRVVVDFAEAADLGL